MRVLLVEDQPVIVAGLTASLEAAGDIVVVGHAEDATATRTALGQRRVDVVLLDLHLPGGAAGDILLECRRKPAAPGILVLSPFESTECLRASIDMGAAGFMLTTSPIETIIQGIRAIRSGVRAYTPAQLRQASRVRWTPLSHRDHQIVAGLVLGRSNDELSAEIGVSRKTVELHLTRLFERFRVMSRTELAARVEREHILKLPAGAPLAQRAAATSVERTGRLADIR